MPVASTVRSIAGRLAKTTGYPKPVQVAINAFPVSDHMDIADTASVARGVKLAGDITLHPGVTIESGSTLHHHIAVGYGSKIGSQSTLSGRIILGAHTDIGTECKMNGEINISDRVRIGPQSTLNGTITIGRSTGLLGDHLIAGDDIHIGKYNAIARWSSFVNRNHLMNRPSMMTTLYKDHFGYPLEMPSKGPLRIGNDVWAGLRAILLTGVTVGDGAVVSAGSVVTHDVEPYEIVGGTPAEHIGWRFDEETREELLEIRWWDWSKERIVDNEQFFNTDLETVERIRSIVK